MGDPKRIRKKYKTPRQPFERHRIDDELQLIGKYGLRNMTDVWKINTMLANFRSNARNLLSLEEEDRKVRETELLGRLNRLGLLSSKATLDDVLSMKIEDFLDRRLQTFVYKMGMATTPHHARQMIVHGHISVDNRITKSPSYLVQKIEEKTIEFSETSPYKKSSHKALPANVYKDAKPAEEKRRPSRRDQKPKAKKPIKEKVAKKTKDEEEEEEVDVADIIGITSDPEEEIPKPVKPSKAIDER